MSVLFPTLTRIVKTARGVLYPKICFHCNSFVSLEAPWPLCLSCEKKIVFNDATEAALEGTRFLDACYFLFPYQGMAKRLVLRYKINHAFYVVPLVREFLNRFVEKTASNLCAYEAITPIPTHRSRLFPETRTISSDMAGMIANCLKVPVMPLLHRTRTIAKQTSLGRRERLLNPRGSLKIKSARTPVPSSVLLTDDVITTGATADEAARVLKERGARQVAVFALARG